MTDYFQRLYSASPMPLKAIGLGLLCGILTWASLSLYESRHLSELLLAQAADRLHDEASSNRMLFHRYLKQHVQLTQLMASLQPLVTWLDQRQGQLPARKVSRYEKERPHWFPPVSTWRGLINPDLFLLHDFAGNLEAVYRLSGNDLPRDSVLQDALANGPSDGQIHLLALAGHPHLVTSSAVQDAYGRRLGSLALISRIDDEFVAKLNHASDAPNVILGLFEGGTGRLVASNQPIRFAKGVRLEQFNDDYLTTGKPFFDYGASELRLQLATLIPLEKTVALNATILQAERRLHLLAAVAFTLSFTLLIFYWSRRIEGVLKQIHGFSQRVIGESREFRVRGDALWQLEEDFIRLRAELFGARELLRQQQVEMERLKQLELLETVAEHLGIGVVLLGPEGNVALKTQRVERLEATLGEGWYRPSLGWSGEKRELVLEGELQRPVTFMVTRLSLFREDDVVLYQDVTERTRLRTRLHEQKLQLHRVTQSARDAIVSIDVHGNVVQWNRAAETLFQHSALEVLGRPVTRIMPEAYREALRSALRRTATSGVAHLVGKTLELEGLRKDGTTAVIELSLSSFEYKKTTFIPVSSGISPSANGQKRPFRKANRGFPRSWTIYRQRSSSRRPIAGCFLSMSI